VGKNTFYFKRKNFFCFSGMKKAEKVFLKFN
jgi:hypothetical protein